MKANGPLFLIYLWLVANIAVYTSIPCKNLGVKVPTLVLGSRFYQDYF